MCLRLPLVGLSPPRVRGDNSARSARRTVHEPFSTVVVARQGGGGRRPGAPPRARGGSYLTGVAPRPAPPCKSCVEGGWALEPPPGMVACSVQREPLFGRGALERQVAVDDEVDPRWTPDLDRGRDVLQGPGDEAATIGEAGLVGANGP